MPNPTVTALRAVLVVLLIAVAGPVGAEHWRGRCASGMTGTDLGFVESHTKAGLQAECGLKAMAPVVSEPTEIPCAPADEFYGCEAGGTIDIKTCNALPVPAGASPGRTVKLDQGKAGRSCVSLAKATAVEQATCAVYSPSLGWASCVPTANTSGCPYAATLRLTLTTTATQKIYCWTVWNEADHVREFTLWVK